MTLSLCMTAEILSSFLRLLRVGEVVTIAIEWVFRKWVSNNRTYFGANQHTKFGLREPYDDFPIVGDDELNTRVPLAQRWSLRGVSFCNLRWVFLYFTTFASRSFHVLFLTDQMNGYMATFQLLGRSLRKISKPDLTTHDKQRLPILGILDNFGFLWGNRRYETLLNWVAPFCLKKLLKSLSEKFRLVVRSRLVWSNQCVFFRDIAKLARLLSPRPYCDASVSRFNRSVSLHLAITYHIEYKMTSKWRLL